MHPAPASSWETPHRPELCLGKPLRPQLLPAPMPDSMTPLRSGLLESCRSFLNLGGPRILPRPRLRPSRASTSARLDIGTLHRPRSFRVGVGVGLQPRLWPPTAFLPWMPPFLFPPYSSPKQGIKAISFLSHLLPTGAKASLRGRVERGGGGRPDSMASASSRGLSMMIGRDAPDSMPPSFQAFLLGLSTWPRRLATASAFLLGLGVSRRPRPFYSASAPCDGLGFSTWPRRLASASASHSGPSTCVNEGHRKQTSR